MISFILALLALVAGYFFYGRFVERVFGADDRPTPAVSKADGVDFMVLPSWKIFMIQFLNIAGTGPIFGAIMGAKFGPAAYLWIVFGCIFAGAVHDYLSGMLSVRHGGANLPDLIGTYLGKTTKTVMLIFSVLMLMMVGAVFVFSPAKILGGMWEPAFAVAHLGKYGFWIAVVFIYYIIATMLPIDKIIGRIYPLFAFALIFMAISLMVVLFVKFPDIPEVWEGLKDTPGGALTKNPIFPCLFISIACGAISGFHATQSPLMARCMDHEKKGRPIFYGAMITEGAVALIWATVASYFFYGKPEPAFQLIPGGAEAIGDAPSIVNLVCNEWLGVFGGILALLGVVAAPITSGDTALRSARLGLPESGAALHPQAPLHLPAALCGGLRPADVADERRFRFRKTLGMVRLVEPDAVGLHALDADRLSGHREETVCHHAGAGALHDLGMHHVLRVLAQLARPEPLSVVRHRFRRRTGGHHLVFSLAQTTFSTCVVCGNISTGCTWMIS